MIGDGRAITLFGSASKSIEVYTHGAGWTPPAALPAAMFHHEYYPWTYLLPDGRLFIAGPHVPTQQFDWTAPAGVESFATTAGDRSSRGEKGTSVMAILRPPDYRPLVYIMAGDLPGTADSVEQIDLPAPTPSWTPVASLNQPRAQQCTATPLPDGRIHIAGGLSGGADGGPTELFDPRNPGAGWILGPTMTYVRGYHSSFLLLRDDSVLGGGDPGGPGGPTPHERFCSVVLARAATVEVGAARSPTWLPTRLSVGPDEADSSARTPFAASNCPAALPPARISRPNSGGEATTNAAHVAGGHGPRYDYDNGDEVGHRRRAHRRRSAARCRPASGHCGPAVDSDIAVGRDRTAHADAANATSGTVAAACACAAATASSRVTACAASCACAAATASSRVTAVTASSRVAAIATIAGV